jgi:hypothetical protein
MRRFLRENSLSISFFVIFVAALCGQAIAGHSLYNQEALTHGDPSISLWRYVTSSSFGQAVMENWQSEYLQFTLFMLATVWLLQRGSPESKELDAAVTGWTDFNDEQRIHGDPAVSWWTYVGSSTFWESTFQNWQSEFLAVGSFIVLAIFLRQRGSPESKPVGTPHEATGIEG